MTTAAEKFNAWQAAENMPEELKTGLDEIKDDKESIYDAFYKDLTFGTAGLRGVMGPGTNRMNTYVVRRSSQGVAEYVLKTGKEPAVVIGYDSRNNSEYFAYNAASVFAANGIKTYVFKTLSPVAEVSYAIMKLHCTVGIMVTASHNPKEYNGYKVYNHYGYQITKEQADTILEAIGNVDIFQGPKGEITETMPKGAHYVPEEVREDYLKDVLSQQMEKPDLDDLSVIYTPLNGAGLVPVMSTLEAIGLKNLHVVESQRLPDGNFPTCPKPNPEASQAFEQAFELDKKVKSDLILATDPDCDRVGVALPQKDGYRLLSGNELAVLLFNYICVYKKTADKLPKRSVAVRSIVSTPIVDKIAAEYNIEMRKTLIGFKYIGEIISELEQQGERDRFVFGFEESKGYLADGFVKDKEGVSTTMLICQMAAHYKNDGKDLAEVLNDIYNKYGFYLEETVSEDFEGYRGAAHIAEIMENFRNATGGTCLGLKVVAREDYMESKEPENILEFVFESGAKLVVRPSGSEPKIKYYLFANGKTAKEASDIMHTLLEKLEDER